jgi:hypothetical protein
MYIHILNFMLPPFGLFSKPEACPQSLRLLRLVLIHATFPLHMPAGSALFRFAHVFLAMFDPRVARANFLSAT